MCFSRSVSTPETPKVDPAPTPVKASDVSASTDVKRKEKRNGFKSTVHENRGTILGALGGEGSLDGSRKFLGSKD